MTTAVAKRDMYVQTDVGRRGHDLNEKGSGFEKSLAKTTSISSVGDAPLLRI
jgi:hypothetical protein